jgi:hypothetical protein
MTDESELPGAGLRRFTMFQAGTAFSRKVAISIVLADIALGVAMAGYGSMIHHDRVQSAGLVLLVVPLGLVILSEHLTAHRDPEAARRLADARARTREFARSPLHANANTMAGAVRALLGIGLYGLVRLVPASLCNDTACMVFAAAAIAMTALTLAFDPP